MRGGGGGGWDGGYRTDQAATAPVDATTGYQVSQVSAETFQQHTLHPECDPKGRTIFCSNMDPVVVCLDVTGSMGNWSKVMYDKLPMFFGQIVQQGYLQDPAICFAACGDAYTDSAPLQVTDFSVGSMLDGQLSNVFLEGKGGGQNHETYELAAYYFCRHVQFPPGCRKPFFFFTGDEGFYDMVSGRHINKVIGEPQGPNIPARVIFDELREKYHVFLLHKPNSNLEIDAQMVAKWRSMIGAERVLHMTDPKAIVDIMLGAIALTSGTRDMSRYVHDLQARQQTNSRIAEVSAALDGLSHLHL
eukprot:gnl/Spiro4/27088_TR13476_c0_g1_i1.p1 gnl/Spiro4/27088_TR13476_c0_g1~~gnl/Spiro4/27088_TR13476_c0_g1_i1.p1  ORF type:complete len:314 (+),score=87.45 gnl/Spiro4/27088_TR13476_c0_g1_i1:35-943(+)